MAARPRKPLERREPTAEDFFGWRRFCSICGWDAEPGSKLCYWCTNDLPKPTTLTPVKTAANIRRRALNETASGFATPEQVEARWEYYRGKCWMCRKPATDMDHVKPLSRGGSNWPSNLRPACQSCNSRKGSRWPFELAMLEVARS
jgi:5-methylcytosine-specific restriction endonuclease McrA